MKNKGFTLVELLVSMVITVIIIAALVVVTNMVTGAYNDSSDKIEVTLKADAALEVMSNDVEVMVTRPGNNFEWFYIGQGVINSGDDQDVGGSAKIGTNAQMIFLYSTTDRYGGETSPGSAGNFGGDISLVSYRLAFRNEIGSLAGTSSSENDSRTFALYRHAIDPDLVFDTGEPAPNNSYLGIENLDPSDPADGTGLVGVYDSTGNDELALGADNLLVENIIGFTAVFQISHDASEDGLINAGTVYVTVKPLEATNSNNAESIASSTSTTPGVGTYLSLNGTGIDTDATVFGENVNELVNARIRSVTFTVNTVSSRGIKAMNRKSLTMEELSREFADSFTETVILRNAL